MKRLVAIIIRNLVKQIKRFQYALTVDKIARLILEYIVISEEDKLKKDFTISQFIRII